VDVLSRAVASHPKAWPLWHDLGLCLAADGRPEDAISAYENVVRLGGGGMAAVWVNLGNALRSCGKRGDAVAAYRNALAREPELAAAHYNLHAAVYDDAAPEAAIAALREAVSLRSDHLDTRFYLGALLSLHEGDDGGLLAELPETMEFLRSSLAFVRARRTPETRLFADTFETLRFALSVAKLDGVVVELGVRRGTSLRLLAGQVDGEVHGFDSFQGLPEAWGGQLPGLYTAEGALPEVPDNAVLHVGWFADVVPGFAARQAKPLRLANVDCDLYTSTSEGLDALAPLVVDGSVLVFDEYLCNPEWEQQEHRALTEAAERHGWRYRYLAFSLFTKQAVIRVG